MISKQDSSKSILFIAPTLGRGGVARIFHQISNDISSHHKVKEAVFDRDGYESSFYNSNISLYVLDEHYCFLKATSLTRYLTRLILLRRLIKRNNFDTVVCHTDGAISFILALPRRIKKIAVTHTTFTDDRYKSFFSVIKSYIIFKSYNRADHIVCVGDDLKSLLQKRYNENKLIAIKNYFDNNYIKSLSNETVHIPSLTNIVKDRFIIVSHGRFSSEKNLLNLIDILKILKDANSLSTLVLIGDGPLYKDILDHIKSYKLEYIDFISNAKIVDSNKKPNIILIGYTKNPFPIIAQSDLFVLTSRHEGYPLSLCEAILCKKPVLSADCPTGPAEILNQNKIDIQELLPIPESLETKNIWVRRILDLERDEAKYDEALSRSAEIYSRLVKQKSNSINKWLELLNKSNIK